MDENRKKTWRTVRANRAKTHRAYCVAAANRAIAQLQAIGVDAMIFGSLADSPTSFRPDSDIDICILNNPGVSFARIEDVVRAATKPVSVDLVALEALKPTIQQCILKTGVRHVD